ncbi:hypothetical protein ACFVT5_40285 [Streptomyces sp. NPDC058001]
MAGRIWAEVLASSAGECDVAEALPQEQTEEKSPRPYGNTRRLRGEHPY